MAEYTVREFLSEESSPFADWFTELDSAAASRVTTALYRLEHGNFSNVRSVGTSAFEYKIDFGQDGKTFIILLCGGTKKTQPKDIDRAKDFWREYKTRKKEGG